MSRKSVLCNQFILLKRTFHIATDGTPEKDDVLLCELSQYHVCIGWAHGPSKKLKGLSYYELRNLLEPDKLDDIFRAENLHDSSTKRVVVSNAFKNILLVPGSQFTEEGARGVYGAMHGNTSDMLFFDDVQNYNLVVVHAVPQGIMERLKRVQPSETTHVYSCSLHAANALKDGDGITLDFTGKEIRITALKENQLKLAQTYFYTAPLDVVYYLLSICREYGLSQSGTPVVLSGLVSQDSAMYKELYQYFSGLRFWKPTVKATLQSEYPDHFFSSLYNLAACVL